MVYYMNCQLNIVMVYGGCEEIMDVFCSFFKDQQCCGYVIEDVFDYFEEDLIELYLYILGQLEFDFIFCMSGEVRLSGFLLWQSVYFEFYFCDVNWLVLWCIDILCVFCFYYECYCWMGC